MSADHILAFALVILFPLFGRWSWRRLLQALAQGRPGARLAAYSETIVLEWVLAVAVLLGAMTAGRPLGAIGLAPPLTGAFALSLVMVIVISALLLLQLRPIRKLAEPPESLRSQLESVEKLLPHSSGERSVFMALSLTAGFCEELLYRGFLIAYLAPLTGNVGAVFASAIVFGLIHAYQGTSGILKTGLIGLVMGVIYLVAGSIWPAIILHAVLDIQGGLIGYEVFGRPAELRDGA